jgi:poly-gamma-glutamate synthase PgsB/CapB
VSAPGYPNSGKQVAMPINALKPESHKRVLVTGSRGKSSVVRLLHAVMQAEGLRAYARITGVVPRELGPDGVRGISRSAGAHVEEMRWWLRQLPASTQAIVLENSAIAPDLQALAGRWLKPDVTVLTNTLPDHQELWGPTAACAAEVLVGGVPRQGRVVLPACLEDDRHLMDLLVRRQCRLIFADACAVAEKHHHAANLGLALCVAEQFGLAVDEALQNMLRVPPDRYDFRVANCGGAEVAMAFSANDITSTRELFRSLSWSPDETRLIYNHRADRPGRLHSFIDWLGLSGWREVLIIGDRPAKRPACARYMDIKNAQGLLQLFEPGDRIFGCGNIAGIPMSLAVVLDR